MEDLKTLKQKFKENPADPNFADYAEMLRLKRKYSVAIRVCLEGLTRNPSCDRGRLVLARIYYDCGYIKFAVRELAFLHNKYPQNDNLEKLLGHFKKSLKMCEMKTSLVFTNLELKNKLHPNLF